jgi:undecaprenyl-diphosphatase
MVSVTTLGTKGALWWLIAAGIFLTSGGHLRWMALLSCGALLLAEGVINLILKPMVQRERPYVRNRLSALLVPAPGAHSWPSAHAGSSMAAAVVLASAFGFAGIVFLALALLIGYSRIYVGVHYPLDVGAGFAIGTLCGAVVLLGASFIHNPGVGPLR